MQTVKQKKDGKKGFFGIRGALFLSLGAFTVLILLLVWVFLIELLGHFYQRTKFDELESAAKTLSYYCDDEKQLSAIVSDVAAEYYICISVYRLEDPTTARLTWVAGAHLTAACASRVLSSEKRSELYRKALENGGSTCETVQVQAFVTGHSDEAEGIERQKEESEHALMLHVDRSDTGTTYLFSLDSKLEPLRSTVTTLRHQFYYLAVILLAMALLCIFLIAHFFARPIISMSASAKRLAEGDYGAEFCGVGFRETEELASTLNYASAELSKTDRLQKELIANISHDLRTPLTMIKGYSEIMRDLPGENTPENVQVVIDETERLCELVSDLLDLSRIQSGVRDPEMEPLDLTATVRTVMRRYHHLTEHDGYAISFSAETDLFVRADRTMLLQVIYNLINNAVNYAGSDKTVLVCQTVSDGKVRISVTDHGAGIPAEALPDIWNRYYRVDRVHKRASIGTGLGLSIAREALEVHKAAFGAESKLGEGSTFWFELPILQEEREETAV